MAYGEQNDYFDDPNCIGWVRSGAENQSPIAVLISNDQENSKSMFIGQEWANQTFVDLPIENHQDQVTIDEEGYGQFPVSAASVSVWAANTILILFENQIQTRVNVALPYSKYSLRLVS